MQITIIQAEIEQAIRNYVGSQLKVADGMEMTIELSATRGAEGFKATIDISPAAVTTQPVGAQVTATPAPTAQVMRPNFPAFTIAPGVPAAAPVTVPATVTVTEEAKPSIFASRPPRTPTEVQAMMAAEAEKAETPELAGDPDVAPATTTAAAPFDGGNATPAAGEGEPDPAPASTGRSLFKGLTRPKN